MAVAGDQFVIHEDVVRTEETEMIDEDHPLVLTEDDANAALSFRNLPKVTVTGPREYGVYELLRAREVVYSRAAYQRLVGSREEA